MGQNERGGKQKGNKKIVWHGRERKECPGLFSNCCQETQLLLTVTSETSAGVSFISFRSLKMIITPHCDIKGHMLALINHHFYSLSLTFPLLSPLFKTKSVFLPRTEQVKRLSIRISLQLWGSNRLLLITDFLKLKQILIFGWKMLKNNNLCWYSSLHLTAFIS